MYKVPNKNDILYYTRVVPKSGVYDLCELKVRTVEDTWFVGVDKKDKRAYLLPYESFGETIFENRKDALKFLHKAENNKLDISDETYYEED